MSFDLTNKNISDTFQNLLQKTGSGNQLYDLKGNQIEDLTIAGALHAQSYIVSQSVSNLVVTSGSTIFGDSVDDTHTFTGDLTLSASGTTTDAPKLTIHNAATYASNITAFEIKHSGGTTAFKVVPNMSNAGVWNGGQNYY